MLASSRMLRSTNSMRVISPCSVTRRRDVAEVMASAPFGRETAVAYPPGALKATRWTSCRAALEGVKAKDGGAVWHRRLDSHEGHQLSAFNHRRYAPAEPIESERPGKR